MQSRIIACIAIIAWASCRDAVEAPAPLVLRVSAGNELSAPDPRRWTGSTSYALDLVYEQLSAHASASAYRDRSVVLRRNSASPHDLATLCAGVYYADIEARKVSHDGCVLTFASVQARERFMDESLVLVEVGPFRIDQVLARDGRPLTMAGDAASVGAIEMVSDGSTAIDRIRILSMPIHEEWRRLFAHQIDVIPSMPVLYRWRFAGMQSVRTVELPASGHVSLFFDTARDPWSSRALRRLVATIIDREAVAALACGEPGCAARAWAPAPPAEDVALPARLSILVLASHTPGLIAARTISYQLRKYNDMMNKNNNSGENAGEMTIDIEELPLEVMFARALAGDFDLQIAPLGFLVPAKADINIDIIKHCAVYTNPALTRALHDGDEAAAIEILAEDVPVLPLYENREFAAVDTYFCGGVPSDQLSWAWLADLYPCPGGAPR